MLVPDYKRWRHWLVAVLLAVPLGACAASPAMERPGKMCDEPIPDLYERLGPAVVAISATSVNPYKAWDRVERVAGSGVIVDAERGLVLTNAHVVYGRQYITVMLHDGTTAPARLVGADPIFDLAVLKLPDPPEGLLKAADFGDSSAMRVGSDVVAIGNPLGLQQTVTSGVVSSIDRVLPIAPFAFSEPYIQTDAPINPGSSGGPLLNRCGEIIGINTAVIAGAQNIGFAVPSNLAQEVIPRLKRDGRIIRPWIGFQGQFIDEELQAFLRIPLVAGLLVEVVEPGGPAQEAGIQGGRMELSVNGYTLLLGGDIITAINGEPISSTDVLTEVMRDLRVGSTVRLEIFRMGETKTVEYRLPERPLLPGDVPGRLSGPGVQDETVAPTAGAVTLLRALGCHGACSGR